MWADCVEGNVSLASAGTLLVAWVFFKVTSVAPLERHTDTFPISHNGVRAIAAVPLRARNRLRHPKRNLTVVAGIRPPLSVLLLICAARFGSSGNALCLGVDGRYGREAETRSDLSRGRRGL